MRTGIISRLVQLEKLAGMRDADPLTVIIVSLVAASDGTPTEQAPLSGYSYKPYGEAGKEFMREVGESDDDVLQRAKQSIAAMRPVNSVLVFHEIRG